MKPRNLSRVTRVNVHMFVVMAVGMVIVMQQPEIAVADQVMGAMGFFGSKYRQRGG